MRFIKNDRGFTLIELMVVVGIIAILLAIAIPNYQKYQAKARQTEAKLHLSAVYTAERAFSVENSTFTVCLRDIGVAADNASTYYMVGFVGGAAGNTCGATNGANCDGISYDATNTPPSRCNATTGNPGAGPPPTTTSNIPIVAFLRTNTASNLNQTGSAPAGATMASVAAATFTATAIGNISSANVYDVWTVNQGKTIANTTPGL